MMHDRVSADRFSISRYIQTLFIDNTPLFFFSPSISSILSSAVSYRRLHRRDDRHPGFLSNSINFSENPRFIALQNEILRLRIADARTHAVSNKLD